MRYVYISLIALLSVLVLLFMVQNLAGVTVAFLGMSLTMPLAVLAIVVYLTGMATGSALMAFVGTLVRGVRRSAR
jgi:lipopolysaccharide assembly protein A